MTTICLIRHGETDWNAEKRCQGWENTDLNENGRVQAAKVAEELKKMKWDAVISSPIPRALSTAKIICGALNIDDAEISINDDFKERNYGLASGMYAAKIKEAFPDGIIPGIENNEHLEARVMKGLTSAVCKNDGKNIIIVSHGGAIAAILRVVSNGEINTGLDNACISLISCENNEYIVESYNESKLKFHCQ